MGGMGGMGGTGCHAAFPHTTINAEPAELAESCGLNKSSTHACLRTEITLYTSATSAAATIAGRMKFSWLDVRLM